jgi:hypothetical protein
MSAARTAGIFAGIVTATAFMIFLAAAVYWQVRRPLPEPGYSEPCTVQACIEIHQADGARYSLNDFRMLGPDCIAFISMPDGKNRKYCGKYDLKWIGPDTSARKEQTI